MGRTLELLPVPTGRRLLDVLPRIAAALDGSGPALLPVAAGSPGAAELADLLGVGRPLTDSEDDPDDPTALVVATSGSTGQPKGVLLTRSALAASAAATAERLAAPGGNADDVGHQWLLALPAQHIAGMQVLLRALAGGSAPHILDTAAPFTPGRFVEAAHQLPPGRRFVSLVPTQLHRVLAAPAAASVLAGFSGVLVGGAATSATLRQAATSAGVRIVETYGMTETCGGCVYDGVPLDGVGVHLDVENRVRLSGAVVARGYRGRPSDPAFAEARTFRTNDLGRLREGRLVIIGRMDDVIIVGGQNIHPGPVEQAIAALPTVGSVVVVGVPDPEWGQQVVAVVVPAPNTDPPQPADLTRATAGLPAAARPRRLLLVDDLPMRGPGKPDRTAIAAMARRSAADPAVAQPLGQ